MKPLIAGCLAVIGVLVWAHVLDIHNKDVEFLAGVVAYSVALVGVGLEDAIKRGPHA